MPEAGRAVLRDRQQEADLPEESQARADAIYRKYAAPTTEVRTWKTTEDGTYQIQNDMMIALARLFEPDQWAYTDEEWDFLLGRHNAELKRRLEVSSYVRVIVRGLRDVGLVTDEQVSSALLSLDNVLTEFAFNDYALTDEVKADVKRAIALEGKVNRYQVKWLEDKMGEQILHAGYEALGIRAIEGIELTDPL